MPDFNKTVCLELGNIFCRRVFVARFVVNTALTLSSKTNIAIIGFCLGLYGFSFTIIQGSQDCKEE